MSTEKYTIPELPEVIMSGKEERTVVCAASYDKLKIYLDRRNIEFEILNGKDFPEDLSRVTTVRGKTCHNTMCVVSKVKNIFDICEALPYYAKQEL